MKMASLFTGIGGFDLGFEKAGVEVIFQCEIDPFCQKVLKKHWPEVCFKADVTKVLPSDIMDADILCAGFPCQDLSLANQGKRKGLYGNRSGLFYRVAELAQVTKPNWIVLENVVGLLNSHDGEDFQSVISTLDELGYFVAWRVLDAKYFGSPQRRRRVFIVASLEEGGAARVLFDNSPPRAMDSQSRLPGAHSASRSVKGHKDSDVYVIQHASIGRKPTAGPQAKGYRNDGETYTLDSRGSSDVVCSTNDGFRIRSAPGISRELDGRRLRALGNAVNVDVIEWLANNIIKEQNSRHNIKQSCL